MENGNPHPSSLGPLQLLSSSGSRVYLDHNATTPPATVIRDRIDSWLENWGNPSSIHWAGRGPKALMRDARRAIAEVFHCQSLELIFTSGGSEANNLAIKGFVPGPGRNHYMMSAVEHPSVFKTMMALKSQGMEVDVIPVNRDGQLDLEFLKARLSARTALVSVMYANNETGHIFPIQEVVRLAHAVGARVHCDAVQALGKAPIDLKSWGVDLATFAAHKFYGLKGSGVLFARQGTKLQSLIHGGGQERGRRAGTENLLAIAAFAAMMPYLKDAQMPLALERMARLRDYFETAVRKRISGVVITGAMGPRIPNTSSLTIDGVDGETLLMNLDMRGFSVSTGAACSSGNPEPSPVLLAMGLTRQEAQSSLRVSLGWTTTDSQIESFLDHLEAVVSRLRSFRHGEQALLGV